MTGRKRDPRSDPVATGQRGVRTMRLSCRLLLIGSACSAMFLLALPGSGRLLAATPDDPAGVPFLVFAQAWAAGDYALACEQLDPVGLLRLTTPRSRTLPAARSVCQRVLRARHDNMAPAELASSRIVKVRVKPGRARVTVQTELYGVQPRATGTAIMDRGVWRIRDIASDAHVGASLVLRVPSFGMAPTLQPGDYILADQSAYRHTTPQIDDLVVFYPPAGADDNSCARRPPPRQACAVASRRLLLEGPKFVKRIVGRPGDRLSIRNGRVIRNGQQAKEDFIIRCATRESCHYPRTFTVPRDSYYVLGDNRGESDDSRFWGPITAASIVGKARRLGP